MGAWGNGPLDSDQALDWLGNRVTDPVGDAIDKLLLKFEHCVETHGVEYAVSDYAHELRAAGYVTVGLNFFRDELNLHGRLADALRIVWLSEWMNDWTEPEDVKNRIKDEIDRLDEGQHGTTLFENLEGSSS